MSPNPPHLSWYKGCILPNNLLEVGADHPALLYGASAFTTMRVYHRSLDDPLTSWSAHRDRLSRTLENLEWNRPDWGRIRQGVETLLSRYQVIRVAIFPDGDEFITGRDLPEDLAIAQLRGIAALMVEEPEIQRSLPAHKTGNYLPCWLALNRARQIGAREAILVDLQGNWLETSTGNLWGWKDGQWWTPSLESGILPGIRRAQLLNWLSDRHFPVGEVIWEPSFVADLETLAYTNCAIELIPIHTVWQSSRSTTYKVDHAALAQLRTFFTER